MHIFFTFTPGSVQGYALVEYENFEEAQAAIKELDGTVLHTEIMNVDWAFSSGPAKHRSSQKRYFLLGSRTMSLVGKKEARFQLSIPSFFLR